MKLLHTLGLPACNVVVELQFPRKDQSQAKSRSVDYKARSIPVSPGTKQTNFLG